MTDLGLTLVTEHDDEEHPPVDAVAAVRDQLETARTQVKVELSRLRTKRAELNDRIRDLVAQDVLLDRMARIKPPKGDTPD